MLLSKLVEGQKILACGGRQDIPVPGIAYDSRRVRPGFLFVAIEGFQTDGHRFIEQAVAAGAAAVVIQKPVAVPAPAAWVRVADSRLALGLLAARYYGYPSRQLKMAGVTGTNGKTTTSHLLAAIGRATGLKVGLIGTIANRIGDRVLPVEHTTPESLDLQQLLAEMVAEKVALAVMEVSSHALALNRVAGCDFDLGIFTNITQDHLDFHHDMDDYLAAKSRLFASLGAADGGRPGTAVINRDDPRAERIINVTRAAVTTYGMHGPADVRAEKIQVTPRGVHFHVTSPWGRGEVRLKLTGLFNVYNALAALAAGGALGIPLEHVITGLQEVSGVPGRFELVDRGQDFAVVVDYAHTPDGLENVLKTARQITGGRLITLFGCGGDRDRGKRPLMGEIAARLSDLPVLTSDNPRTEDPLRIIADVEEGLSRVLDKNSYRIVPDRREAIFYAVAAAEPGDTVVIAGKGHEDYQIIGTEKHPFDDRQEAMRALEQIMRARGRNGRI
ncbi:UDP-N-acetylmuramoyl-L-alanyl-D-glutamate--2,6-diaminopimelate ligase [Desulfotomaculum copahuensis]|uniref:UDP-N-acetylmuramoyl-L-alanyl-D-glutamate--2,6-diaminopimelate ligase n=1 Tax=Desulfotomaculum copahuensis TaxID=1838280 RepID=A0A1B7LEV6_9FIRM|nr:UDP-N-acetylmuramoyl-L-alanyl-D-glutamate--2,6-diaminopimelate ligase [Desulfotomaculum copahuensis]OAT81813.1 UDP-N-acetylmuramoyl-L-alanyl-D-glutamate--2,6-diaminopimelate ligase [Desulfotomaculum copahuensis]